MYIAKRPFKFSNKLWTAGSIVEPASIKNFRRRFVDGDIIEVNEQNFKKYQEYFKVRYGVDIPELPTNKPAVATSTVAQPKKIDEAVKPVKPVKRVVKSTSVK